MADLVEKVGTGVVNLQAVTVETQSYGLDPEFEDFFNFFGVPRLTRPRKSVSRGSGFVIDSEGYVITNNHVVQGSHDVLAILGDKEQIKAKLIGADQKYDIALLKLEGKKGYTVLHLGDSDRVRIGEDAIAIGNPFGLQNTVTRGIISAKHRTIGMGPFDDFLQTDTAINPGNSGGPLFNEQGDVIGVNAAIKGEGRGIGFAIPINVVKKIVPDLKKYGRVMRQWLGVVGYNASEVMAYNRVFFKKGVFVENLVKDGPADKSGIEINDVIIEVNGKEIDDVYDLQRMIEQKGQGEEATTLNLKILRGSKKVSIKVPLEFIPREEKLPRGYPYI